MTKQVWIHAVAILALLGTLQAQVTTVRGKVEITGDLAAHKDAAPATVVWLTPLPGSGDAGKVETPKPGTFRLVQKNKSFQPHLLVVPVGSVVDFPNRDPFFHNVFSLFEGKRFDLGLYEAGSSRLVHFDRPGVSYIFCNIHPEMSAVVITLTTSLYAIANGEGKVMIGDVPYGRYLLHIWSEQGIAENAQPQTREITISQDSSSLGTMRVAAVHGTALAHKNKYGRDYDDPTPDNPAYTQQP